MLRFSVPSLHLSLKVRPVILRVIYLPDLEILDREQNKSPTIQVETLGDLLLYLDCHKSMVLDGIHPRVLRELVEVITKPLPIFQCS